jgi:hypothetical protein
MKPFCITVVSGMILIMCFVLWVDPSYRWHRRLDFGSENLKSNEVWVWPWRNMDERTVKLEQLQTVDRIDILLFGSSRAMVIRSSEFNSGFQFFNVSVNSMVFEDYLAFWEAAKEKGKIPHYAVFYADPWILNAAMNSSSWNAGSTYSVRLRQQLGFPTGRNFISRWNTFQDESTAMVSWASFLESVRYLRDSLLKRKQAFGGRTGTAAMPNGAMAYRADGSVVFPAGYEQSPSLDAIRSDVLRALQPGKLGPLERWTIDRTALVLWNDLIADMQAAHVKVMVIMPPYQKTAFSRIKSMEGYSQVFPEFSEAVQSLRFDHPDLQVCDVLDAEKVPCSETEFRDAIHMLPNCAVRVIQTCFEQAGWENALASNGHTN